MNLNDNEIRKEQILIHFKSQSINPIINNVTDNTENNRFETPPYFTNNYSCKSIQFEQTIDDTFPSYLTNCETIAIPKRVKRTVERLPKSVLNKIDSDKSIAVEKCLDFVSNLTGTIFYDNDEDKWKNLHSTYLDEKYRKGKDNTRIYKRVIDALTYSTDSTFPIIEVKKNEYGVDTYLSNEYSKLSKKKPEGTNPLVIVVVAPNGVMFVFICITYLLIK